MSIPAHVRLIQESANQLIKPQVNPEVSNNITASSPIHEEIWVKNSGKPSARDLEAADALIKLVGSDRFKFLLKDKTSKKKNVWAQIAKEMMVLSYNFGNRDPGTVCFQKWRNMEGKTVTFIQNGGPKSTGAGKLKRPVFYDEVRNIIKDSAKATPVNLMDTMSDLSDHISSSSSIVSDSSGRNTNAYLQEPNFSSAKDSDEPKILSDDKAEELVSNKKKMSLFLKIQSTTKTKKRKVDNSTILDFLKQDAEERKKQNENLVQLLAQKMEKEEESKKQMLEVLSKVFDK